MRSTKNIEKLVQSINAVLASDMEQKTLCEMFKAQEQANIKSTPDIRPEIWSKIMKSKKVKFSIAATLVIIAFLGLTLFDNTSSTALAETLEQLSNAKTITWDITFYTLVTSQDKKRTWIETETRQCAYKAPSLYREVFSKSIEITDTVNLKQLSLVPEKNEATLSELAIPMHDSGGAFAWEKEHIKENNLELVETRETKTGKIHIFRSSFWDKANNQDWSYDFWIDAQTKQLVAVQVPGADIYDPENHPANNNPPETEWSTKTPLCSLKYNINYNAKLDETLFRLVPPEGYTLEMLQREHVTEEQMVDFLGILAEYYDGSFPEQVIPFAVSSDKMNAIWDTPEDKRTKAEQKLLETTNHYKMANLNMLPIGHFIEDHTVKNSFRYIGKGVLLGDRDRIVCWYKLKDTNTYRAVYGDLRVEDIRPEELPLQAEP